MSTEQVDRLQALLSRVQENRGKPREIMARVANGAPVATAPQAKPAELPAMQAPAAFGKTSMQDGIDTTPPPAAPAPAPVAAAPMAAPPPSVQRGPARGPTAPAGFDRLSQAEPATSKVSRAQLTETGGGRATDPRVDAPSPRRAGAAPGSTPLEMALEGEVARVAAQAPEMSAPESLPQGRVIADPTPPTPSKPIAQAVTKHPPVTGATFGDVLRRSLALRPR